MRKWNVNSYVLSVCLLISEYVRQQQQDAKRSSTGDSVASLVASPLPQSSAPTPAMSRRALNTLAHFLILEIQHPRITTLWSLLQRLEVQLEDARNFEQLPWQLVSILTKIESPDAVWNTVEQITDCVAPLQSSGGEEQVDFDSASSMLVRTSLLGVFVRSFLLAVNRLLFDGLSRLFDDVQQYLNHFRQDVQRQKRLEMQEEEKDSSLESPASQYLWKDSKVEDDELLLSPIPSTSATLTTDLQLSNLMTPVSAKLDLQALVENSLAVEPAQEMNDPEVWSNDQLNCMLSDLVREIEGKKSNRPRDAQRAKIPSMQDLLRLLRTKMDRSNPHVLFVRYLCFLSDRDYQGALDSLHQYHDVLSPQQGACVSGGSGSEDTSSASRSAEGVGLHFDEEVASSMQR